MSVVEGLVLSCIIIEMNVSAGCIVPGDRSANVGVPATKEGKTLSHELVGQRLTPPLYYSGTESCFSD